MDILAYQLTAPLVRGPYADLAAWLRQLPTCPFTGQVERALWGGFHADRLGLSDGLLRISPRADFLNVDLTGGVHAVQMAFLLRDDSLPGRVGSGL